MSHVCFCQNLNGNICNFINFSVMISECLRFYIYFIFFMFGGLTGAVLEEFFKKSINWKTSSLNEDNRFSESHCFFLHFLHFFLHFIPNRGKKKPLSHNSIYYFEKHQLPVKYMTWWYFAQDSVKPLDIYFNTTYCLPTSCSESS